MLPFTYISEYGRRLIIGPRRMMSPGGSTSIARAMFELRARLNQKEGILPYLPEGSLPYVPAQGDILSYSPDQPRAADGKFGSGSSHDEDDAQVSYKLSEGLRRSEAKNLPEDSTWERHKDWKQQAYGGVIVNSKNRFLLREPSNHFDGYSWTWPKGKMDGPGEHPVDTALRETTEETGRHARIFDTLPGNFKSASGSNSNFYLMRNIGFDKSLMDKETKNTKWADYKEAKALISQSKNKAGRARDLAILEEAHEHLQSREVKSIAAAEFNEADHPRDASGKFTDGGGIASKDEAHEFLKQSGFTYVGKTQGPPGHDYKNSHEFYHPQHGKVWTTGPTTFYHEKAPGAKLSKGKWSTDLQTKFPVAQKPILTPQETAKIVEQATVKNPYTPENATLASLIPAGMHSEYSKLIPSNDGSNTLWSTLWSAVYNQNTGMYDKSKNGMLVDSGVSPSKMHYDLQNQTYKYTPTQTAVPGTGPAIGSASPTVKAPIVSPSTAQVTSKPVTPSLSAPKGTKASLAAKIPSGMHSSYTKIVGYGPNWHAKFNPDSGNYQVYKGTGKIKTEVTPEHMAAKAKLGYQPDKSAVAGTGPPQKATPIEQTKSDFTYKSSGGHLGGAHEKYIFTDKDGKDWMFKPATTLSGAPSPMTGHAEEMASKIQLKVTPDSAVEVKAITLPVPGKGEQFGSIQKLVANVEPDKGIKDFSNTPVDKLAPSDVKQLQQQQVVDWLISNHDSHGGQFIRTTDSKVIGIDKGQAFKYFPGDKLSTDYRPNTVAYGEKQPYYNDMWAAVKAGKLSFDPQDSLSGIKKAENISDTDYKKMLEPYAQARFAAAPDQKEKFLDEAVARKNNLKQDFEKFYSAILGKDFKFDESKLYSQKPEGASQAAHQALEDAGYKFEKLGAKTSWPLYKDPSGKAVYISDAKTDKFEYYPMGTHGTNPYGSAKGEGLDALKTALATPLEKFGSTQNEPVTKTTSTSKDNDAVSTKNYPTLADVTYAPVKDLTTLPSGQVTGGDPKDHYTQVETAWTSAEKQAVTHYKGSDSTDINKAAMKLQGKPQVSVNTDVAHMDSAVMKAVTNKDLVVWRGLHDSSSGLKYATFLKDNIKIGDEHTPHSFQETSLHQSVSHDSFAGYGSDGGLMLKINVPKGTPVIPTTALTSSHSSEKGLIFSRNVSWVCKNVYSSGGKVYMEVDLKHPGIKAAAATPKMLTAAEYGKLLFTASKLGWNMDKFEMTVSQTFDSNGVEITSPEVSGFRKQLFEAAGLKA